MAQTPTEVWVSKPEIPKVVVEMLLATAQEYDLTLWINGVKIHEAKEEEEDDRPKS
jgi:hypothetical protein